MQIIEASIQSLVEGHVILGRPNSKGWQNVKCQVCNDYKERGAFIFDGLGSMSYSCFNCGVKCGYSVGHETLSKKVKEVLLAFMVPEDEIKKFEASLFFNRSADPTDTGEEQKVETKALSYPSKENPLPAPSFRVSDGCSDWCEVAAEYLKLRGLATSSHPFFVSENTAYEGRVIIPYYFRGKLIYWQARSLDASIEPRYKNPPTEKDNIFFNMDELYRHTDEPLLVTEGPLDALSIGPQAVALLGSTLSEFKTRELRRAARHRKVIFVLDKNRNGKNLGKQALELDDNFHVTVCPDNIEDANEGLIQLGHLYLLSHLSRTAGNGFQGRMLIELKCSS